MEGCSNGVMKDGGIVSACQPVITSTLVSTYTTGAISVASGDLNVGVTHEVALPNLTLPTSISIY